MDEVTITQEQLDATPPGDHPWRWPGVVGPGHYKWDEENNAYRPVQATPIQVAAEGHPHDFDSGLGIGGAGRHNLRDEEAELVARGQMQIKERKRIGPMPHGQLWEPCRKCGNEPVCLDCELCKRHCTC